MSLNIQVNSEFKIVSDPYNIVLQRKFIVDPTKSPNWERLKAQGADPTPREEWRDVGYYSNIDAAINGIIDRHVHESDADNIGDLLREIKEFRREISAIMGG